MQVPATTCFFGILPAATVSIISSGLPTSSFLQAKPSTADLLKGGMSISASTFSAKMRPVAFSKLMYSTTGFT
jgi:hypothetical protein